jgi:catalase
LIKNLAGALGGVKKREVQENMLALYYKIHPDYGTRLSKAIGVPLNKAKL